jgi:hypothetical protein
MRAAILQSYVMTSEDPGHSDWIEQRVQALATELERARFAGASPGVEIPADASTDEVVARALAAERFGVPLVLRERAHNLHEQRAWEALRAAQDALGRWSFGEANARLDRSTSMAVDPGLQQRLGLWKALAALVRRLVRAHPDDRLQGDPAAAALDLLETADRVPDAERNHYRAEVQRLVSAHATARETPGSLDRALWYLIRVRQALAADEPVAALIWCIQLGKLQVSHLPPESYAAELLATSRTYALLQLGELAEEASVAARKEVSGLQAWDVYRAVSAQLSTALGIDLQRELTRLTITPYRDADD